MTNAEKIAKNTKLLARMIRLANTPCCEYCVLQYEDCRKQNISCTEGIKMWLEREAKDEQIR